MKRRTIKKRTRRELRIQFRHILKLWDQPGFRFQQWLLRAPGMRVPIDRAAPSEGPAQKETL